MNYRNFNVFFRSPETIDATEITPEIEAIIGYGFDYITIDRDEVWAIISDLSDAGADLIVQHFTDAANADSRRKIIILGDDGGDPMPVLTRGYSDEETQKMHEAFLDTLIDEK